RHTTRVTPTHTPFLSPPILVPPLSPPFPYTTLFRSSRALDPSEGPTTPRDSIKSMRRPARANPTRNLRCSIDVDPNCEETTSSTDRKSTRLNSSHVSISYAVFCLKKKTT